MGIEAGEVIVAIDDVPLEEAVVITDPIDATLIATVEPISFVSEDYVTFDMGTEGDAPVDDSLMFTTTVVDGEVADESIPDETFIDDTFIDGSPVDGTPADGGTEPPADDGADGGEGDIFITVGISGDTPEDGTVYIMDENGEIIGRPVDPMPNWRSFDGEAGGGEDTGGEGGGEGGSDGAVYDDTGIVYDDTGFDFTTTVVDKDLVGEGGEDAPADEGSTDDGSIDPVDVIYTLDPSDPLIYATTAGGEMPGRPVDPQPFERGNAAPAVDPAAPDSSSDVVQYAAAEPFHTGLDLL